MSKKMWGTLLAAVLLLTIAAASADTAAHEHLWGEWTPAGDGSSHVATCEVCGEAATVACTRFTVTIAEKSLRVCPFCGRCGERVFAVVPGATAAPTSESPAEQRGAFLVRGMAMPFEADPSILYAFTMAYGQDGKLVTFQNVSQIRVPLDGFAAPGGVRVVRVAGAAGDDSNQTAESWNDLRFTMEDGLMTFENRTPSLYMIIGK